MFDKPQPHFSTPQQQVFFPTSPTPAPLLPSSPLPRPPHRPPWQSVIEETSGFPDWTFHYTTSGRVTSATQMQEEHVKDKQRTGEIFANLIITTQADYFVGALASNWNRLIDELRSTNGRLYSGHVALNEAWT
ncbi:unnamed protein product [Closterium sp. NIES-53]